MAFPLLAASLLGGTALGLMRSKRQQDQADQMNKFRKAAIQFSPWTGMQDPGPAGQAPSSLEGALGGAFTGMQMAGLMNALGGVEGLTGGGAGTQLGAQGVGDIATTGGQNYLGLEQDTLQGVGGNWRKQYMPWSSLFGGN